MSESARLRILRWCGAAAMAYAAAASAHDTWVQPDRFRVPPKGSVTLSITSGMEFPRLDHAIRPDRIDRAIVRTKKATLDLPSGKSAEHALEIRAVAPDSGVAVFGIESKPNEIELGAAEVDEYLDEIRGTETIGSIWKAVPEPKKWRELYVKHAKTFVRAGDDREDPTWGANLGMAFEVIPASDPTVRRTGESIVFTLVDHSGPVARFPVDVVVEGIEKPVTLTTDERGKCIVDLPKAGRYLVRATRLRRSSKKNLEWESDFTTATFEVK